MRACSVRSRCRQSSGLDMLPAKGAVQQAGNKDEFGIVTRFLEFWFLRGFLRYVVSFQWLGRCCVEGRMSREWRRRQVDAKGGGACRVVRKAR